MTTNTTQNRVQKGVSTGGQYAATVHGESPATLGSAAAVTRTPDPFPHLEGMEKARAQAVMSETLAYEATNTYVKDISRRILAENPDAARLYVSRELDAETGMTFSFDVVKDQYGNETDIDVAQYEDTGFTGIQFDGHVDFEEESGELYVNLDPGD